MRTTKRFSPKVLDRFRRQGRGQGLFQDYVPWHRIGRSDPSSRGRSHLQTWNGRHREVLSDHEWVILFFVLMLMNLVDFREQFPLNHEEGFHELSPYLDEPPTLNFPGTLELAKLLGIRHPKTRGDGESANWIMSTDFLLTLLKPNGELELLAISGKLEGELEDKRTRELLSIEREYWKVRGVTWLLITPALFEKEVALLLRMSMPWALGEPSNEDALKAAVTLASSCQGRSLTFLLQQLSNRLGDMELAQRAFWQGVWNGKIPLDLRRGWRPHQPILLLDQDTFLALNPIVSRRSTWI